MLTTQKVVTVPVSGTSTSSVGRHAVVGAGSRVAARRPCRQAGAPGAEDLALGEAAQEPVERRARR